MKENDVVGPTIVGISLLWVLCIFGAMLWEEPPIIISIGVGISLVVIVSRCRSVVVR